MQTLTSANQFLKPVVLKRAVDETPLPPDVLRQLASIAGQFNNKAGHIALLTGATGTAGTLAAAYLGNHLGKPVYRIDLAGIVSKYIGETEKNLDAVFAAADRLGTVLLFDEADSLFGQRTEVKDAHDRYANMEVSYLLKRIEAYAGLVILTTNQRDNLDAALLKHVTWIVAWPEPLTPQRKPWWRRII